MCRAKLRSLGTIAAALATLAISACGGSGVGNSGSGSGPAPNAVITPIGYQKSTASGTPQITVRSGAAVVLSAKDSDGRGIALKSWTWSQNGGPALPSPPDVRALLYVTSNTVTFRAPQVTQETHLSFQVQVTNSQDVSSTAQITVNVLPANDPSLFLLQPGTAPRFTVAVLTSDGIGTSTAAPLSADVPVCVAVRRTAVYMARDGTQKTASLPQLTSLQADATWAAGTVVAPVQSGGSYDASVSTAVGSYSNPRVSFEVPEFNDEELLAMFNQPGTAQVNVQLVPSDVDSVQLQLAVTATPGSCDGTQSGSALANSQLIVALLDSSGDLLADSQPGSAAQTTCLSQAGLGGQDACLAQGGVTGSASRNTLTRDEILDELASAANPDPSVGASETAAMAEAYYKSIDPNAYNSNPALDTKATLNGWLADNCFDPTSSDYGTSAAGANGAHAVYTNNYDLGFGRDMYFIRCTADHTDANGNVTAHAGDMASVVLNYPDDEQAAAKDGPTLAVAMEYGQDGGTGPAFTKFYVYAPDDRTGAFDRVLSANFDGRGQKYIPNSCAACHGGKPPSLMQFLQAGSAPATDTYPLVPDPTDGHQLAASGLLPGGDIDSAFLPWDLDSFLYSDTDPAFSGQLAAKSSYTRSAQEPNLKALNAFVYQIYQSSAEPEGSNGVDTDRYAAAKALIEKWYGGPSLPNATYCDTSTCDATGATPAGWAGQDNLYHNAFARNCRTCHTLNSSIADQFSGPTGYAEFQSKMTAGSLGAQYSFEEGVMPLARLTMDRFWADYAGSSTSAGQQLVQALYPTTPPPPPPPPGNPNVVAASTPSSVTNTDTQLRVDASGSFFVPEYDWTLAFEPTTVGASSVDCSNPTQTQSLVGARTAEPAFLVSRAGCYVLTLAGSSSSTTALYQTQITVPAVPLTLLQSGGSGSVPQGCPGGPTLYTGTSATASVSLGSCFAPLSGGSSGLASGNPPYTLSLSIDSGATWISNIICGQGSATAAGGTWSACISCPQAAPPSSGLAADACNQAPSIQVQFSGTAPLETVAAIQAKLCDSNGSCVPTDASAAPVSVTFGGASYFQLSNPASGAVAANITDSSGAGLAPTAGLDIICSPYSTSSCTQPGTQNSVAAGSAILNLTADGFTVSFAGATGGLTLTPSSPLSSTSLGSTSNLSSVSLGSFSTSSLPHVTCYAATGSGDIQSGSCTTYTVTAELDSQSSGGTNTCGSKFLTGTSQCPPVELRVVPLAPYGANASAPYTGTVYGTLASCAGSSCHSAANTWTYTSQSATYTSLCSTSPSSATNAFCGNPALVSPGDPRSSLLYTAPCVTHESPMNFASTSSECEAIYQWILEGAPYD